MGRGEDVDEGGKGGAEAAFVDDVLESRGLCEDVRGEEGLERVEKGRVDGRRVDRCLGGEFAEDKAHVGIENVVYDGGRCSEEERDELCSGSDGGCRLGGGVYVSVGKGEGLDEDGREF